MTVEVRRAAAGDLPAVMGVVEGALLEADAEHVRERIRRGAVLVAVTGTGTVVGALVLDGPEIDAVAVRRSRRDQGIGSALVGRALEAEGRLVAAFDGGVRDFYEALGFAVEPLDADGRYVGVRWSGA